VLAGFLAKTYTFATALKKGVFAVKKITRQKNVENPGSGVHFFQAKIEKVKSN
jgi:hypothetical protein